MMHETINIKNMYHLSSVIRSFMYVTALKTISGIEFPWTCTSECLQNGLMIQRVVIQHRDNIFDNEGGCITDSDLWFIGNHYHLAYESVTATVSFCRRSNQETSNAGFYFKYSGDMFPREFSALTYIPLGLETELWRELLKYALNYRCVVLTAWPFVNRTTSMELGRSAFHRNSKQQASRWMDLLHGAESFLKS